MGILFDWAAAQAMRETEAIFNSIWISTGL
jgi:hypothetical protein